MMVWMWYDCMIVVWWFGSCVCECECIQIEEIAKKCKTKNRLKEPQKTSLTFKFFCNISSIPRHGDSLKISEDSRKRLQSWSGLPSCIPVYLLKTLKSKSAIFYIIISKKCTILKSLQGLQEHHETYTQLNQNTGEDFLE